VARTQRSQWHDSVVVAAEEEAEGAGAGAAGAATFPIGIRAPPWHPQGQWTPASLLRIPFRQMLQRAQPPLHFVGAPMFIRPLPHGVGAGTAAGAVATLLIAAGPWQRCSGTADVARRAPPLTRTEPPIRTTAAVPNGRMRRGQWIGVCAILSAVESAVGQIGPRAGVPPPRRASEKASEAETNEA